MLGHIAEPLVRQDEQEILLHRSIAFPANLPWERDRGPAPSGLPGRPSWPTFAGRLRLRQGSVWKRIAISQIVWIAATTVAVLICMRIFFSNVGHNPAGLFADEAQIGVATEKADRPQVRLVSPALFYIHLGYHNTGTLPLFDRCTHRCGCRSLGFFGPFCVCSLVAIGYRPTSSDGAAAWLAVW